MTNHIDDKPSPCPFCGGAAAHGLWAGNVMAVSCLRCFAGGPATEPVPEVCINIRPYIDEAYRLWNRRAALSPQPAGEGEPVASISTDGPHKITENRRWLARQLLDSKLDEGEAYGIVAYSPAIKDALPLPSTAGEEREAGLRLKLIAAIDQWDAETDYDTEDHVALADEVLRIVFGPHTSGAGSAEGWKLVPEEPTATMAAEGARALWPSGPVPTYSVADARKVYAFMLSAAPSASRVMGVGSSSGASGASSLHGLAKDAAAKLEGN